MSVPEAAKSLHVLMTADAVGGVWQYALDLARGLRTHDVRTTIAVLGPWPSVDQQTMAEAAGAELVVTGLPLDWTASHQGELKEAGQAIARLAAQIRPDLIHLNTPALAADACFNVPVVAACHSCVATWWQAVKGGTLPEDFIWRTDLVRRGYASAGKLLAPTLAFAQATSEAYDLTHPPVVVRNGRRGSQGKTHARSDDFVFTAGRLWDEGKNFATIDRMAELLPIQVLAAGPLQGPNSAQIEAHHAKSLGRLSDEDVARHLSRQPIFVSTAFYEPFGLAILEAAQAGCALVLSDIPTFRELWEGAALFVNPRDENEAADAVKRLVQDMDARGVLGRAARKRAETYTVEAMSEGVLRVYQSVLAGASRQSSLEGAAA
ncbi:glycosyltransferase involved in cell wall biosynthesis [Microvirga lupini]|uniref:Glycosyltransferase involved in cell wall biosynthesis n=1 Tax=Microvirga lupini TaxID=420324 RepID=A0A7W4VHD9_9HYPH|nr:glycosyltransferase family 4 protein [Microvirga lupini]MBB3017259.1 glycosyltransferase involved in cell wall biosynthesis [Microvirga lupini]